MAAIMSAEGTEHMDGLDLLIRIAMFGCFVVFGICMLLIRRGRDKRKAGAGQDSRPPKISNG